MTLPFRGDDRRGCLTKKSLCQNKQKHCHCEPVTDVTGVAIPPIFRVGIRRFPFRPGDSHASVRYFLGMTVLLFVLFFFSETAPLGVRHPPAFHSSAHGTITTLSFNPPRSGTLYNISYLICKHARLLDGSGRFFTDAARTWQTGNTQAKTGRPRWW